MINTFIIISASVWPIRVSILVGLNVLTLVCCLWGVKYGNRGLVLVLVTLTGLVKEWRKDVTVESRFKGNHTCEVVQGIYLGFVVFLISEGVLFVSLLAAYFHLKVGPSIELGIFWPGEGICKLDWRGLAAMNTLIRLASSGAVTWSHHGVRVRDRWTVIWGLTLSVVTGATFTLFQGLEYIESRYSINDGVYGNVFFILTGLHGLHVIVGTLFLLVSMWRWLNYEGSFKRHLGVELSIIYWHFVDYVWLVVYGLLYILTCIEIKRGPSLTYITFKRGPPLFL